MPDNPTPPNGKVSTKKYTSVYLLPGEILTPSDICSQKAVL